MTSKPKLEVGGDDPKNIDDLLPKLFWKEPELAAKARDFLGYVREWARSETPYRVSQWGNYCARTGLTQSQYHNILRRLKGAGMIEKKYNRILGDHELRLSGRFSGQLSADARVWDDFLVE